MAASVEKTYADALFAVADEKLNSETAFSEMLEELKNVNKIIAQVPELVKLMETPTVTYNEKRDILKNVFEKRLSDITYNFLKLLAENGRFSFYSKIYRRFNQLYNEKFGITDIIVTSARELDDVSREQVRKRMSQITGKKVVLKERVDRSLIGGVVVDCGTTRYDGSVRTRLESLRREIAETIA
jgi:F-type H+-transporting ATPase subunit delta